MRRNKRVRNKTACIGLFSKKRQLEALTQHINELVRELDHRFQMYAKANVSPREMLCRLASLRREIDQSFIRARELEASQIH